jgi:FG-GAP repeat
MHDQRMLRLASATTLGLALLLFPVPAAAARPAAVPSDFNGDGYADLAVGVPGESINSTGSHAGAVNVLYGSSSGLTASGDQFWSQDSPGVKGKSRGRRPYKPSDDFGFSLASGDFDRDGYADLAIGVPGDRVNGRPRSVGAVNVLYGSGRGLTASGDQRWSQANLPGVPEEGDNFGYALASGDFDGDGFWDLAIGVPGDDVGQAGNEGSAAIVYGSRDGLTSANAKVLKRTMTGAPDASVSFGAALAAGDLDGNGKADLAVGAPGCYRYVSCNGGSVGAFYGTDAGLTAVGSQAWDQDSPGIEDDVEPGDGFGASLAIGDFDADGFRDLAVGVPQENVTICLPTTYWCGDGAVAILPGSGTGLTAANSQLWHLEVAGVPGNADTDEKDDFGTSLAAGDFDGDGRDDLAIGDPLADVTTDGNEGGVIVLPGSPDGLTTVGVQLWTQDSPEVPGTPAWYDWFSVGLASADYDHSGRDDLAIGVSSKDIAGSRGAGMVNILYGQIYGLSGTNAQGWSQDSPGIKDHTEKNDDFGSSLTGS